MIGFERHGILLMFSLGGRKEMAYHKKKKEEKERITFILLSQWEIHAEF